MKKKLPSDTSKVYTGHIMALLAAGKSGLIMEMLKDQHHMNLAQDNLKMIHKEQLIPKLSKPLNKWVK